MNQLNSKEHFSDSTFGRLKSKSKVLCRSLYVLLIVNMGNTLQKIICYVYIYETYRRRINCNRNELRIKFSASSCFIELASCPSIAATPSPGKSLLCDGELAVTYMQHLIEKQSFIFVVRREYTNLFNR
jgi:hypothetical protein